MGVVEVDVCDIPAPPAGIFHRNWGEIAELRGYVSIVVFVYVLVDIMELTVVMRACVCL